MTLSVLGDRCLVRPETLPDKLGSLYVVRDYDRSAMIGEVVALGQGPVTKKGVRLPHQVKVGSRVLFSPDSGSELIFKNENLVCMKEEDILAEIVS